jgi:hypothetical protein
MRVRRSSIATMAMHGVSLYSNPEFVDSLMVCVVLVRPAEPLSPNGSKKESWSTRPTMESKPVPRALTFREKLSTISCTGRR